MCNPCKTDATPKNTILGGEICAGARQALARSWEVEEWEY